MNVKLRDEPQEIALLKFILEKCHENGIGYRYS
jgi:hypothetical protein